MDRHLLLFLVVIGLVSHQVSAQRGSCEDCCDCGYMVGVGCYCDSFCQRAGDCCSDYTTVCADDNSDYSYDFSWPSDYPSEYSYEFSWPSDYPSEYSHEFSWPSDYPSEYSYEFSWPSDYPSEYSHEFSWPSDYPSEYSYEFSWPSDYPSEYSHEFSWPSDYPSEYSYEFSWPSDYPSEYSHEFSWPSEIDVCLSSPCLNGGLCQASGGSYFCFCPAAFYGVDCELGGDSGNSV
ncbi:adhesive plaque matrix protein isoform X13 [Strongylocentrotus purpuratus]|uniref:Uncharacterized protein n=1 Tax=Strongylocentrotus purpuratus TaxID=7668 RepID=A0A7M7NSK7_STRPU|nr:adhesive plaque matrix protein isoform X13 [Strongylocentrotus purpuratus]